MTTPDQNLLDRLASLSPERRALVEAKLRAAGASLPAASDSPAETRIPRRPPGARIPLSFGQEFLWSLDQAVPGLIAYNVPRVLRIRGQLDVNALAVALSQVVERHSALRTRFTAGGDGPEQVIDPAYVVDLPVIDLGAKTSAERENVLRERLIELARKPFDLAADKQLQATLFRLDADTHVLVLRSHHIVSDEWSREVLFTELAAFYDAALGARDAALPALPIEYADYATWQRSGLASGALASQLTYWRTALSGLRPLELPTDRPRTTSLSFSGARIRHSLPRNLADDVATVSREHGVTTFMTLLAAFSAVLHRYTGQGDIAIGSPISTRRMTEVQGLIGYFPNTVVLRTALGDDPTFAELLRRARETTLGAFENQDVPLEQVVQELRSQRQGESAPLFNVMFHTLAGLPPEARFGEARVVPEPVDFGGAKADLLLAVRETADGLDCLAEFRTDLFDETTIARVLRHFEVLLRAAVAAPAMRISALPLLTDDERHRLLREWNDTDATWPRDATLHGLFETEAQRRPDAIAVQSGDDAITYAELDRRANRLAWQLRERGVGPESLVAVCMDKSADVIAVLLGILKAGGAYVPMDPAYPDDRLAFMLEDCASTVVVTDAPLSARLRALGATPFIATDAWSSDTTTPDNAPPASARPENVCYVIYTSGSTGKPKGVLIEHRNVVRLLFNDRFQFDFSERDVWTVFHSFSFDFSVWEMYGALLYGGRVIVIPREVAQQPSLYLDLLAREGVTVLNQVPSAFYTLMAEEMARPDARLALRYLIFGGEALQPALLRDFHARYPATTLINMFGITETTVHVTFKEIGDPEIAHGASNIGGPIPTLTTYVLDEHLQLVPFGVTGEICVGGAGVARGYLKRPELSAERFIAHPYREGERMYRSGDLGRIRPTGEIEYLGRRDAQVKIRGFRIELGEIETALLRHPAVSEAVVTARPDRTGQNRLVAYIVARGDTPAERDLRVTLRESLPEHMVPGVFVFLDALPLSSNGKADRKALPEPHDSRDERSYVEPRSAHEREMSALWADVLQRERIGAEDGFLDVGGDSLTAMRIIGRIRQQKGVVVPLALLLRGATVAEVASVLAGKGADEDDEPSLIPVSRAGFRRSAVTGETR